MQQWAVNTASHHMYEKKMYISDVCMHLVLHTQNFDLKFPSIKNTTIQE